MMKAISVTEPARFHPGRDYLLLFMGFGWRVIVSALLSKPEDSLILEIEMPVRAEKDLILTQNCVNNGSAKNGCSPDYR